MILKMMSFTATCGQLLRLRTRQLSTGLVRVCLFSTKNVASDKIVYHSQSKDIFENLALEEWLFENTDLTTTDVLLVWQSNPCVVIGRHQNPWLEANMPLLEEKSVSLARRSSGGGAVYHDHGNLNLSFMKDRKRYDRRENLQLVVDALTSRWDLDLSINERDDIVLEEVYKVSGTAAKLSRAKSYHHFTLLHSLDQSGLSGMLVSPLIEAGDSGEYQMSVDSKSTQSVRSSIQNLMSRAPKMTFDLMIDAITSKFVEGPNITPQSLIVSKPLNDSHFPGISKIYNRLQTWDWLYGKTPKFSVKMNPSPNAEDKGDDTFVVAVNLSVEKGCLASFLITLNNGMIIDLAYVTNMKGLEMKRENAKLFASSDILLGRSFSNAYPHMNVQSISNSLKQFLPKLFEFL